MMKITSTFALLDVKAGRARLAKEFEPGVDIPVEKRRPVVIYGTIVGRWSQDDGTSQEFTIEVTDVVVGEPGAKVRKPR